MQRIFSSAKLLKESLPEGKTFSLVAGCFDLIHIGHINLLERAKGFEELLVVGILSDDKIRKYKGIGRPIISQDQRAEVLSSIRHVDFVFIADIDPIGEETIEMLKPNSVIFTDELAVSEKVSKWTDNIIKYSPDTKVRIVSHGKDLNVSTSRIIDKIRSDLNK